MGAILFDKYLSFNEIEVPPPPESGEKNVVLPGFFLLLFVEGDDFLEILSFDSWSAFFLKKK